MERLRPTLGQIAVTLAAFAVLFAFAIFFPLTGDNLSMGRTHATAWAMTLLATPALYVFARTYGREPLDEWWRLTWTAGFVMALAHFWFGQWEMHGGDPVSVFVRQGPVLAGSIYLMMALWAWDVVNAWVRPDWREEDILSRRPAFWVAVVTLFVSTVLFNNDAPSLIAGLIMTGALLLAAYQRADALGSWRALFDSPLPPAILGVGLASAALFGPPMLAISEMTPAEVAASQAKWTVWPALFLGGVAATILIARAPAQEDWGFDGWQMAGAGAYLVHVYAGFWNYFGGSFGAMLAQQGWLVGGANLALVALWTASAAASCARWRRATPLHVASVALFIVSALLSSWDRSGAVFWLAAAFAAIWALAAALRVARA